MKQTNNAIKFLMAQYRAIFKNAYFKGLTSAVLLTAGLAVGAAQADTVTLPSNENNAITSANADDNIIIDGEAYFNGQYSSESSATSITITNGSSLSTYHPEGGNLMGVGTSITLNGGSLNLTNSWVQGLKTFDEDTSGGFSATLTSNGNSEINLTNSLLQVGTATLNEGTTVNIGGVYPGAVSDEEDAWNTASAGLVVQASGAGNASTIVINGADINIDDDGLLSIQTNGTTTSIFTMNAGTITLTGSELARRASSDSGNPKYDITTDKDAEGNPIGAAIVSTNSAVANFNGGQIIVNEGEVGQIHGNNMNFKGTTFDNTGTMQIGGRLTVNNSLPPGEAQNINMTAGAINNSGILLLGSAMSYDGKTLVADGSVINAKGGTISNTGDGEVHIYSTLQMTGADIDNEGNLIVENGAKFELDEQKNNKGIDGVLTVGGTVQVDGQVRVSHGTLDLSTATSITSQGPVTLTGNGDGGILVRSDTGIQDAVLKLTEQQAHDFLNNAGHVSGEQRDSAGYIAVGNEGTVDFGDTVTLSDFNFWVVTSPAHQTADPSGQILVYSDTDTTFKNYAGANFKATTMTLEDALLRNDTTSAVEDLPATTLHADNLNLHYDGVEAVKDFDGNFSFTNAIVGKNLDVTYEGGDAKLKIANDIELSAYTPATTVNNQTTHAVAQDGTITGNDFVLVNDGSNHSGSISVEHGHWTATQNITLTSGTAINVGLDLDEDNSNAVYANTTDSSLALNGGLTFDLASGDSSVTVTGTLPS